MGQIDAQRMRALALEIRPDGFARPGRSRSLSVRFRDAGEDAALLTRGEPDGAFRVALSLLRRMEDALPREQGPRLPAMGGTARVVLFARALVEKGDAALSREEILSALAAFDGAKSLTMEEIWCVPLALRQALAEAFLDAFERAAALEREKLRAEAAAERGRIPRRLTDAFLERAMRLAAGREDQDYLARLEAALESHDDGPEACAARAHGEDALLSLRMENLGQGRQVLAELDWEQEFPALSRAEQELNRDPAGIYPDMDDASRAYIRRQVAVVASRLHIGEVSLARHAGACALSVPERNDVRRNISWWLATDEGRAALLKKLNRKNNPLPRLVPDTDGKQIMLGSAAGALLLTAIAAATLRAWIPLLLSLPLAWCGARMILNHILTRIVPPAFLCRMEQLPPDSRCIVTLPVLLTGAKRAREAVRELESLGALDDTDTAYLLLGDFRDGDREREEEDEVILSETRAEIEKLNQRAGREKYFYLHRPRTYFAPDRKWMGRERKRGAIMDLCALLLRKPGAESAFSAENSAANAISEGNFQYCMTLDAGTRILPGSVRKLLGTAAHPLNRRMPGSGYAVFQPVIEQAPGSAKNAFARLFGGEGGVNPYPASASDLWQDAAGRGLFSGKGLFRVEDFDRALAGALPDGRILSHDLFEGALARCALVNDVTAFDGFPASVSGYRKRLNRWTRGDWQLLPFLFSGRRYGEDGVRLPGCGRFWMLDNLIRSLAPASGLFLLIYAAWASSAAAWILALAWFLLPGILSLLFSGKAPLRRLLGDFLLLPVTVSAQLDAIFRTLFRLLFTKRHMLDWVTAADSDQREDEPFRACYLAGLVLLPGILNVSLMIPALLAAGAFFLAPTQLKNLEAQSSEREPRLTRRQIALYTALARDSWKYFDAFVMPETHFLPPDNVQQDPPVGPAERTSPTNIGLYLVCCAAAHLLGFIRTDEFARRADETLSTLESMEKWRGMPYNWYDITDLSPLYPKYVSSVDSGNLAASLLMLSRFLSEVEPELAERAEKLAREMDLKALYDERKKLFTIGYDAANDCMSRAHYDLLASESRILSMTAILLGKVPPEHWQRLGRPSVMTKRGAALLSWSGTMFEYLMPGLFMKAPEGTLLRSSERTAVAEQIARGRAMGRPWGVSESGYAVFDPDMNYQYHAFGLSRLALSGPTREDVIAPYASALAAAVNPAASADNLIRLSEMGLWGTYGPYEALDMTRGELQPVKSWMAHHQGMSLAAACNVLTGDALANRFMEIPEVRAASLLLEEKPMAANPMEKRPASPAAQLRRETVPARSPRADAAFEGHILSGGGTLAVLTAGGVYLAERRGIRMGRVAEDLPAEQDGVRMHFLVDGEEIPFFRRAKARFFPGKAEYALEDPAWAISLTVTVSPESGSLVFHAECENRGQNPLAVTCINAASTSLMTAAEERSHPAFHGLFLECSSPREGAILTRRKPRNPGDATPCLLHESTGGALLALETDRARLFGRTDGVRLTGLSKNPILPASAIARGLSLPAGGAGSCTFSLSIPEGESDWTADVPSPARAARLSALNARSIARFSGADEDLALLAERMSAILLNPRLPEKTGRCEAFQRDTLWQLGLSGDLPILTLSAEDDEGVRAAADAVKFHAFLALNGIACDLVLIARDEPGYAKPVRDGILRAVLLSHFAWAAGRSGGAHILDGEIVTDEQLSALTRASAIHTEGDFRAAVRKLLFRCRCGRRVGREEYRVLPQRAESLELYNRFGGFRDREYAIDRLPPAAWCNILANDRGGTILSERGGGCLWAGNSRFHRIFPFVNDPLQEGCGWMLYAGEGSLFSPLLPGTRDMSGVLAWHSADHTVYEGANQKFSYRITTYLTESLPEMRIRVELVSRADAPQALTLTLFCNWLAGCDGNDARFLSTWHDEIGCYAAGAMEGVCYAAAPGGIPGGGRADFLGQGGICNAADPYATGDGGYLLRIPVTLPPMARTEAEFSIGTAADAESAIARAHCIAKEPLREIPDPTEPILEILTPDPALNHLFNDFLHHQVLASRVQGRTGLYQPGGAYGFRDQLQDMLSLIPTDPARVKRHILLAAARQFEAGDGLHWWHVPSRGVRTRIADDVLFLPYVASIYARETSDRAIFEETAPFLQDVPIPEGKDDLYDSFMATDTEAPLYDHCMRAIRRVDRTGSHGLCLMLGGDWNDGMNRVGDEGRGESVWLSEFLCVTAESFLEFAKEEDADYLRELALRMRAAVESFGWDGAWYLRAYTDEGAPLGGRGAMECEIDAISQAWAVLSGMDEARCKSALDSAWDKLVDEDAGIVRLLAPPFRGETDPGYIAAYPPGVRENGAQYTHAAVWLLLACIRSGDADRTHRLLKMLNPVNHALTKEDAIRYRTEPYVMAGDVYACPGREGMGGWSWYTGAAGWMIRAILALFGYERRGDQVRIAPILGEWEEASLIIRFGSAKYALTGRKDAPAGAEWITLTDDGREHTSIFPGR